jgi:hypothetical protein
MFNDWQFIHAQAKAKSEKAKYVFNEVELSLKELFTNLSELSFDGVLVDRLLIVNKGKLKPFEFQSLNNNFMSRRFFLSK